MKEIGYRLRGSVYVNADGKWLRVDQDNHSSNLSHALFDTVAQVVSVVDKAQQLGAWPTDVLNGVVVEILISISQVPLEDPVPCPTKACPLLPEYQDLDDEEIVRIIPETQILATEGVS